MKLKAKNGEHEIAKYHLPHEQTLDHYSFKTRQKYGQRYKSGMSCH